MKKTHVFEANDGTAFSSAADCKAHENEVRIRRMANLSHEQVLAAIFGKDRELAEVFERVASIIASNRRANGELKRVKKQAA